MNLDALFVPAVVVLILLTVWLAFLIVYKRRSQ